MFVILFAARPQQILRGVLLLRDHRRMQCTAAIGICALDVLAVSQGLRDVVDVAKVSRGNQGHAKAMKLFEDQSFSVALALL